MRLLKRTQPNATPVRDNSKRWSSTVDTAYIHDGDAYYDCAEVREAVTCEIVCSGTCTKVHVARRLLAQARTKPMYTNKISQPCECAYGELRAFLSVIVRERNNPLQLCPASCVNSAHGLSALTKRLCHNSHVILRVSRVLSVWCGQEAVCTSACPETLSGTRQLLSSQHQDAIACRGECETLVRILHVIWRSL